MLDTCMEGQQALGWSPCFHTQVACALPKKGDWTDYILACDKGLYSPQGQLRGYDPYNITTADFQSSINFTLPEADLSWGSDPQVMTGFLNATMTCQKCPQGIPKYRVCLRLWRFPKL